ncbi:anhydro-N-acetylmuramic acid kinase AnmK [uncultured Clostridium sp.]|uniref:anhydro-N-acetylmuramic acid kinase AnmK n=1 Tax=uncultured Clostridium sp. TaxID=59620 RepID=UPI0028EEF83F|nr:anhydro-N-acetylmuramic acid kinase AnmK [uncultured Clostridium sp.]
MEKLIKLYNKDKKLVVGLMSGTSLDGIDCALVQIEGNGINTKIKPMYFDNLPMPDDIRREILECCSIGSSNVEKICRLNFKLGELFAHAVISICNKNKIQLSHIDLIGSHGQTIYHIPQNSTLQIGELSVIAERTNIPVVGDFRVRDIAAGGHGAPLVPYTEYLLYRSEDKTRILQNIGGIGNATILPKNCTLEEVLAFDTGPGNMIIDRVVFHLTNGEKNFDKDGTIAGKGKVHKKLLGEMMDHPYIKTIPPKTTGREVFGVDYTKKLLAKCSSMNLCKEDIVATVAAFTVESIAYHYEKYVSNKYDVDEVIIGGGGSYNNTLISMLEQRLPMVSINTQEAFGYSSDAKEAIAFAILANEAIHGNSNNVPSVTGAKHPVVMGKITV